MSEQRPKRETMPIEKATNSNMWEIAGRNSVYGSDAEEKVAAHVTKDLRRRFSLTFAATSTFLCIFTVCFLVQRSVNLLVRS